MPRSLWRYSVLTLEEPENGSNRLYRKVLTELFRGWAVAMSTVTSLVFLFLPLLFPNSFRDSSSVPASYVWVAAVVCFLAANFMVWRREREKVEAVENGKPNIKLMQPDAVRSEDVYQRFSDQKGALLHEQVVPFLKVRFINDPKVSYPSANATGVRAYIKYYRLPDEDLLLSLDGRWAESDQPSACSPSLSKAHLLAATFGIGEAKSVDIAYCDSSGRFFAWNNDNYAYVSQYWLHPKHLLNEGRYRIEVRLRGDWIDKRVSLTVTAKDKSFIVESYVEEGIHRGPTGPKEL